MKLFLVTLTWNNEDSDEMFSREDYVFQGVFSTREKAEKAILEFYDKLKKDSSEKTDFSDWKPGDDEYYILYDLKIDGDNYSFYYRTRDAYTTIDAYFSISEIEVDQPDFSDNVFRL